MIENLRKYTGGIIFVIALLFIGLAFFGDNAHLGFGGKNDPVILKIDDRSFTAREVKKGGIDSLQLSMASGLTNLTTFLGGFQSFSQDPAEERFFIQRQFLKEAREEFGIHPSDEAVAEAVHALRAFQGIDGSYSQEKYNQFVKNFLGRFGMSEQDFLDLIRDDISLRILGELLGSGLASDPKTTAESVAASEQKVAIQLARLDIAAFRDALHPTDEELEKAWSESKDKYMTEKRIKVSWLLIKPNYPAPPAEEAAPAAQTDEEKKAEAEKKAARETAFNEEKRKINRALAEQVDAFITELSDKNGQEFETLAAAHQWEVKATDFFTRSNIPAELNLTLRSSSTPAQVGDFLFRLNADGQPMDRFTEVLAVGDGEWLVARLDEAEEPRNKTFEEAKDLVRTDWIEEKAAEALKKEAETKAEAIREALAAGKTITEAGTAAGLTFKAIAAFGQSESVAGETDGPQLFRTAALVKPGALADPDIRPDSAVFVFVEKREIARDENRAARVTSSNRFASERLKDLALLTWFEARLAKSKISRAGELYNQ